MITSSSDTSLDEQQQQQEQEEREVEDEDATELACHPTGSDAADPVHLYGHNE